jgi:hypothetical protein
MSAVQCHTQTSSSCQGFQYLASDQKCLFGMIGNPANMLTDEIDVYTVPTPPSELKKQSFLQAYYIYSLHIT